MKKILCLLLAVLLLAGCQSPAVETTAAPTVAPTQAEVPESIPQETVSDNVKTGQLAFANPGKTRITYTPTGAQSFVRYVTSVEELPDVEALAGYDAAFFEEKALLILVETVASGSVKLEIEGIRVDGDSAIVSLKRTMEGDFGTADMATWMLWAEVEKDLDYTWTMENASPPPQGEKY